MATSENPSSPDLNFNPNRQSFTIHTTDGATIDINLAEVWAYTSEAARVCANYGSQIGASFILLLMVLLLTKPEKRKASVFIVNTIALVLNVIRSLLQCLYYTGPWYYPYTFFSQDYSRVPRSDIGVSIAAGVLTLLLLVFLELSLVIQVRVICVTMDDRHRFWMTILSASIAIVAVGFRFGLTVMNAIAITNMDNFIDYYWLASGNNICTTISICFFSLIFCAKLAYAIRQRRKLGLTQFGPLQIIFIMGCQTLVVPAIFSCLAYTHTIIEFGSLVLTATALSLPLSALWASANTSSQNQASFAPDARRLLQLGESSNRNSSPTTFNLGNEKSPLPSPLCNKKRDLEMSPLST